METIIDNFPWIWENLGMQGIIVAVITLIAYFILKGIKEGLEKKLQAASESIGNELTKCRDNTNNVEQIIINVLRADFDFRSGCCNTSPQRLLTVAELFKRMKTTKHYIIFYWTKQGYINALANKYPGIENLLKEEIIQELQKQDKYLNGDSEYDDIDEI